MNFRGRLTRHGRVAVDLVTGNISARARPDGEAPSWSGTFNLPPGHRLGAGKYLLELDDGRSGFILIDSVASDGDEAVPVAFAGRGPLV